MMHDDTHNIMNCDMAAVLLSYFISEINLICLEADVKMEVPVKSC